MIRTIITVIILLGGAFALASTFMFYPRAGSYYISKTRDHRRSIRVGSGYYGHGRYGSGGFRGGK